MERYDMSVIIVNWNTKNLLEKCLDSMYSTIPKTILYEIIVVDNGSIDESVIFLSQKKDIKTILNTDNLGFATANNKALSIANGKYVLFLNTDVILSEGAIAKLLDFMDSHSNCALCTPSLVRKDGSPQEAYISFPAIATELFGRVGFKGKKEPCVVQSVRGACMVARRDIVTGLGGFNEKYFLFLEETDLCFRLNKNGYKVWYVPSVEVYHTGGGSGGEDKTGPRIEYWKSRYIFFRDNYSLLKYILLNLGLLIKLVLDWIFNLIVIKKLKQYSVIIQWHLAGKPGDWGISSGNIIGTGSWLVRKEYKTWLEINKDLVIKEENCELLKENRERKLLIYKNEVYVKIYKRKKLCVKEWRLVNRLRQLDIPTVMPIAVGNGYLITEKLDNVKTLHEFILEDIKNLDFREKVSFTKSFAEFLSRLHRKGILHGDLHSGNILVSKEGYKFYITDLHRARIKIYLSRKDVIKNLVQLDKFFSIEVSTASRLRFFKYYTKGKWDYKRYAGKICKKTENACHKLWQKRDSKYLLKDKYGVRGKYKGVKYILNPAYRNVDIVKLLGCVKSRQGDIIKDSRSSYLSRFNIPEIGNVILKIYKQKKFVNYVKDIFRHGRGLRAWCGHWALITRVIETPLPVIAGEERIFGILKSSFIITKDISNAENLSLFSRGDVLDKLSSYVRKIHDRGIFPMDMKGSNILIQRKDGDFGFYLIDLDHIKIRRRVSLDKRLYNIRQIRKSTGLSCHTALPVKRVLIVKPSSFGDIVQSLPVATTFCKNFPSASIWWLANKNYIDFLKLVPSINKIISFERSRWGKWKNVLNTVIEFIKFIKKIRKLHFDIVLDLQGLLRSGFITGISKAPIKLGFSKARECVGIFYNKRIYLKTDKIHAQERYLKMAEYISIPSYKTDKLKIPKTKVWLGDKTNIRIVVNPGCRWRTKRWSAEKYAGLINILNKKYNAEIVLIGDKNDIPVSKIIINKLNSSVINLTGQTTLPELAAILNECSVLITNDSGPMHLADYLNMPIVAIFGPTDPQKTGPTGSKAKVLKSKIPCSPCFMRYCRKNECMEDIGINDVADAVRDVLQK